MAIYNFCAGPAMLPVEVMQQAQAELIDWNGHGISVMEMSHRSAPYIEMAEQAEQDLRDLMAIPDNYSVLFLHGGGRGQFSAVPLNLAEQNDSADYLVTGQWSQNALKEGQRFLNACNAGQSPEGEFRVPTQAELNLSEDAKFVHYCPNETIEGVAFDYIPETGDKPLIADMSSCILSQPLDVSKFGILYAGAQKNIGPSGLSVVIVRNDLIGHARQQTPSIFDYKICAENGSMYNTPPTYAWYLAGLVFKWLKAKGGLTAIAEANFEKAALLYEAIDASSLYQNKVAITNRSIMNVPFQLVDESLNSQFLAEADKAGLKTLKGHRVVGGMRASIYNAMPLAGVQALVEFMAEFERTRG